MFTRLRALAHHLNHAKMSTATTIHNTNVACCTLPPVRSDYEPKGSYKAYGGFDKVCITLDIALHVSLTRYEAYFAGPEKPGKIALVCVFDIFG